jgi:hypothetical protein
MRCPFLQRDDGTGQMTGESPVCDQVGESVLASICGRVMQRVLDAGHRDPHRKRCVPGGLRFQREC